MFELVLVLGLIAGGVFLYVKFKKKLAACKEVIMDDVVPPGTP